MTAGRRDQLASALRGRVVRDALDEATIDGQGAQELADALLPTVDRMIRQAQAEVLESSAQELERLAAQYERSPRTETDWRTVGHLLRTRAVALRSDLPSEDGVI